MRFKVPEDMSPTGVVGVAMVVEVRVQALAERVQHTAARRSDQSRHDIRGDYLAAHVLICTSMAILTGNGA